MNALEDNDFTRQWQMIAQKIPKPSAILAISAHWFTQGTRIMDEKKPSLIYDMYGFPPELYAVLYPAPGAPELASLTRQLIESPAVIVDNNWGIDHGTWSVLHRMYPQADIPVTQLSVDRTAPADVHFAIGQQIRALREQGVLILASGNVVHNLREISWDNPGGFAWTHQFDDAITDSIRTRDFEAVIHYENLGFAARKAVPTTDHFLPLLYTLGASDPGDTLTIFNKGSIYGSLSMTSYLFDKYPF
jgi:4,5-DOPA dioxygenase extradiol